MKNHLFTLIIVAISSFSYSQDLIEFLNGTWQIEGSGNFEHWDQLGKDQLQGLAYSNDFNKIAVEEYLKIERKGKKVYYTATVLGQNHKKPVTFKLIKNDTAWVFENKKHDFPQQVIYKKTDQNNIQIHLQGSGNKISYGLRRLPEMHHMNSGGDNPSYDENLAKELGADDYGMKKFFFVLLESGTNKTTNSDSLNSYFSSHMANIEKLVAEKKMIVAGPFGKNDYQFRGIFIFENVASKEEVEELLKVDGAIVNHVLAPKIVEWYGSAALSLYLKYSELIWKVKP